jgi:LysM repeat protein
LRINLSRAISATFLILVFLAFQESAFSEETTDKNYTIHALQKGQTLWYLSISKYSDPRFSNLLADYNNITDVRHIPIGTEIKVPNELSYKVKKGDTLSRISKKILGNSKKYDAIAEYNDIPNPNLIIEGSVIRIPLIPSIDSAIAEKHAKEKIVPAVEQIPISEKEVTPEKPKLPEKIEEVVSPPIEEKKIITPTVEEKAVQPEEKKIEEVVTQPEEKEPEPEEIITPPVEEKIIQPELKEEKPPVAEKPEIVPEVKPIEEEAKVEKPTKVKPIEPKPKVKPVDPSEKTWIPEFPWALKFLPSW